jgi:hypothetical protein
MALALKAKIDKEKSYMRRLIDMCSLIHGIDVTHSTGLYLYL